MLPLACITSEQIAADMAAAFGPVFDQLMLLSWFWAAGFFVAGWITGPGLTLAFRILLRQALRLVKRHSVHG